MSDLTKLSAVEIAGLVASGRAAASASPSPAPVNCPNASSPGSVFMSPPTTNGRPAAYPVAKSATARAWTTGPASGGG